MTRVAREFMKVEAKSRLFCKPCIAGSFWMEAIVAVALLRTGMSQDKLSEKSESGSISLD